ncbi:MAG: hypothetical protein KKF16_03350, partial [Euryarchaeota archaeon]|nr:hypothetical protein [Euryarchaeota archaeon]
FGEGYNLDVTGLTHEERDPDASSPEHIPEKMDSINRKMPSKGPGDFLPFKAGPTDTPEMPLFGEGYNLHVTGLTHDERGYPDASSPEQHSKLVNRLCDKILKNRDDITRVKQEFCEDADIILISYGAPSRSVTTAVKNAREEGIKAGYIKIDTPWPFPEKQIQKAAESASKLIVVEMNLGQMFYEVQRVAAGQSKVYLHPKIGGEIHKPTEILSKIKSV